MNSEKEPDSTSEAASLQCITIEDSDDEIEIVPFDNQSEEVLTDENFPDTFVDVLDVPYDSEIQFLEEVNNLLPGHDPLLTEVEENNEKDENTDVSNRQIRFSLCSTKCYLKVSEENRKTICDTFWSKKTLRSKFQFMNELVETEIKLHRTYSKFYLDTKSERQSICKLCFICALKITPKFLNLYLKAKKFRSYKHIFMDKIEPADLLREVTEKKKNSEKPVMFSSKEEVDLRKLKLILGWKRIPPCSNKCSSRITENDQKQIFVQHWLRSTVESRYRFICDMTEITFKESKPVISYYLNAQSGIENVCKSCFLTVISEDSAFLMNAMKFMRFKTGPLCKSLIKEPKSIDSTQKSVDLEPKLQEIGLENNTDFNHSENADDINKELELQNTNLEITNSADKEKKDEVSCERLESEKTNLENSTNCEDKKKTDDDESAEDLEIVFSSINDLNPKTDEKNSGEELENFEYDNLENYLENRYCTRPFSCRTKCFFNITKEDRKRIFYSYWQQKTLSSRINFIYNLISTHVGKNHKNRVFARGSPNFKFYFYLDHTFKGVCKHCFTVVLDVSTKFVDAVIMKKLKETKENDPSIQENPESVPSTSIVEEVTKTDKIEDIDHILNPELPFIREKLNEGPLKLERCKRYCYERISEEEQKFNFTSYWSRSTLESRTKFIFSLTEKSRTATKHTISFYLYSSDSNECRQRVCKKCFRLTLNETNFFINTILRNKTERDDTEVAPVQVLIEDSKTLVSTRKVPILNPDTTPMSFSNDSDNNEVSLFPYDWKEVAPCRRGCKHLLPEQVQKEMFLSYWQEPTLEAKSKFILDRTKIKPTQSFLINFKSINFKKPVGKCYTKKYFSDEKCVTRLCQKCFLEIISESYKFLREVLDTEFNSVFKTIADGPQFNDDETDDSDLEDEENDKSKEEVSFSIRKVKLTRDEDVSLDQEKNKILNCTCESKSQLNKNWTHLPPCADDCHLKINESEQEKIFISYWLERTFDSRLHYVTNMTELVVQKNQENKSSVFRMNVKFHLNTSQGRQNVCQSCFIHVLDVSKPFIEAVFNQKLYTTMKFNKHVIKENMTFLFFNDVKSKDSELNESACEKCTFLSDLMIKQDVPLLTFCQHECNSKLAENDKKRIFNDYWKEKSVESREKFICDMVSMNFQGSFQFDTSRKNLQLYNEELFSYFGLLTDKGMVLFCKFCFCTLINDSLEFVKAAIQKKWKKVQVMFELRAEKIKNRLNEEIQPTTMESNLSEANCVVVKKEVDGLEKDVNQEMNEEKHLFIEPASVKVERPEEITIYLKSAEITTKANEDYILGDDGPDEKFKQADSNLSNGNTDSKLIPSQEVGPGLIPLKRKLSKSNSEETDHSPIEVSVIKEEVDLENDLELQNEESEGPPLKIAKTFSIAEPKLVNPVEVKFVENNHPIKQEMNFVNESRLENSEEPPVKIFITFISQPKLNTLSPPVSNIDEINSSNKKATSVKKVQKKVIEEAKVVENNLEDKPKVKRRRRRRGFKEREEDEFKGIVEKLMQKFGNSIGKDENLNNNKVKNGPQLFSKEVELEKLPEEEIKKVEEHIRKFPHYESYHYNGKNCEKYLPMGLTLKMMHDLYKSEVSNPVNSVLYNKILDRMELKFKISILSKCDVCETAAIQFKLAQDSSIKSKINSQRSAHLLECEEANNSKTLDEKRSKIDRSFQVCSFGFQQSLPTPYVNEPVSYYKQRLWTYNFTIQKYPNGDSSPRIRKFYMWHEGEAKRTADEMSSCLFEYLLELPSRIKNVIFYSTSCNEEDRSKILSAMFLFLLTKHKTLESIEHKFLISGHSPNEENLGSCYMTYIMKKHPGAIHEPNDWHEALKNCLEDALVPNCEIKRPKKFYDFEGIRRDMFGESDGFIDKEVKWLKYTKEGILYKNDWMKAKQFEVMNLEGLVPLQEFGKLRLRSFGKVPITVEKKKDLLELLRFLKPDVKEFYDGLDEAIEQDTDLSLNGEIGENIETSSSVTTDKIDLMKEGESLIEPKIKVKEEMRGVQKFSEYACKNNQFESILVKEEVFEGRQKI